MPASRAFFLQIHTSKAPKVVLLDGKVLEKLGSTASLDFTDSGWFYNKAMQKEGVLLVKLPETPVTKAQVVTLSNGHSYPRLCLETCDSVLHHQVEPQVFYYNQGTGTITLNATGDCLTASTDKDEGSGTPAVEMQTCNKGAANQIWSYSESTQEITLKSNPKQCIDQDVCISLSLSLSPSVYVQGI